jgi:hypothetical protein
MTKSVGVSRSEITQSGLLDLGGDRPDPTLAANFNQAVGVTKGKKVSAMGD